MKKSYFCLILFLLSSCSHVKNKESELTFLSSSESSQEEISNVSNENLSSVSQETDTTVENKEYKAMTYKHVFKQEDFSSTGGVTQNINGMVWNYSPFSFLGGSVMGVQIGSKNNPQTEAWTLSANFEEEVIITGYEVEISNASSGSGNYTFSFGNYQESNSFSSPNVMLVIQKDELNEKTTSFSLSLKANAKAIYFYSLAIHVLVDVNSSLQLTDDEIESSAVVPGENGIPSINYPLIRPEQYYETIDFNANKEELFNSLQTLVSNMKKVSYGDAKTMLQYTDESVEKEGYLYGLYDGDLILAKWDNGASWNREHVWACSQMKLNGVDPRPGESDKNHATDLHNLRVACQSANGAHGNKFYDTQTTSLTLFPNIVDSLAGYHQYEGDFRGDVARILFYMALRYDGLVLNDDLDVSNNVSMGKLSTLLEWNEADPVDDFEIQRNNRIYEYQGNRNPFIDQSNLANLFFE